jgi:hypothetical protein
MMTCSMDPFGEAPPLQADNTAAARSQLQIRCSHSRFCLPTFFILVTDEARCMLEPVRPRLWLPRYSRFMTAFTAPVFPWNAESAIAAACALGMLLVEGISNCESANMHGCSSSCRYEPAACVAQRQMS